MSLISDVQADLGGIRQAYPQTWVVSPKGEAWGGSYEDGEPVAVARQKMGAEQKFQAGIEVSTLSFRLFTELPGGAPPLAEEQRVKLDGMMLRVMSVVPVESPGSLGAVCICEATESEQG